MRNELMLYGLIFIFGLIVGSFLNAVIYRLSIKSTAFRGRSYCPSCKHQLGVVDLIPLVSFLLLKGTCRYCRGDISWQYPLVELTTAVTFVLICATVTGSLNAVETNLQFVLFATYTAFLIIIFVYDLKHYLILDAVTIPAALVAFIGNVLLGQVWYLMLLAAVVAAGFFALQFLVSGGRWIGGGDIRLGFVMGLMLSWPNVLVALLLAYILGSIMGIILIVTKQKTMSSKIPFGTFLAVATFIALLYGDGLLAWYRSLIFI